MTEEQINALCAFGAMSSGIIYEIIDGPCQQGIFIEHPASMDGYVVIPYAAIRDGVRALRARIAELEAHR